MEIEFPFFNSFADSDSPTTKHRKFEFPQQRENDEIFYSCFHSRHRPCRLIRFWLTLHGKFTNLHCKGRIRRILRSLNNIKHIPFYISPTLWYMLQVFMYLSTSPPFERVLMSTSSLPLSNFHRPKWKSFLLAFSL